MPRFDTFAELPPPTCQEMESVPQARQETACQEPMGGRRRIGRLYNSIDLARRLHVSRWTIQMMKRAGLRFDFGLKTTLAAVEEWIAAHPDFKPSAYDKRTAKRRANFNQASQPA